MGHILTEEEESARRQEEFHSRSQLFIDALDVDDVIAHLLVAEGFTSVEQIAYVPIEDLIDIEGFDEEVAEELRARAESWLEEQERQLDEKRAEMGVSDEIAAIEGLTAAMLVKLGEPPAPYQPIKTLDDLGDLASDELIEILGEEAPSEDEANAIIMAARAHWFGDEEPEAAASASGQDDSAQQDEEPAQPGSQA